MNYNHDHHHGQYQNPEINLSKSKKSFKNYGKNTIFLVHCAMSTRHDPNSTPNITSGLFLCQCHFVGGREDTAGFPEAPAGARLEMENRQLG